MRNELEKAGFANRHADVFASAHRARACGTWSITKYHGMKMLGGGRKLQPCEY